MRITGWAAVVGMALLAGGGCGGARVSPPGATTASMAGGLLIPLGVDVETAARMVAERAGEADVVYLGEAHDDPRHHAGQVAVLKALLTRGARPAVAFEMLPENDQELVDGALAGDPSAEEAGRRLRWTARGWPDFSMYWPIFAEARRHDLPVVAADLAPATTRLIARGGLQALGPAGSGLASALPPDAAREAGIAHTIREAHCRAFPEARIPTMVQSWHARNVTLARRLLLALDGRLRDAAAAPRPRVVLIVGAGHQAPGGAPDQLAALRPGVGQLLVEFRRAPTGSPGAGRPAPETPPAGVVWLTPGPPRADPCAAQGAPAPGAARGAEGMGRQAAPGRPDLA